MRRGTILILILLFAVIIGAGVAQLVIATKDHPDCAGPIASPNALPASPTPCAN